VVFTSEIDEDYFVKMIEELKNIRDKYGLSKGVLLIPDRIDISIKRNSYDNMHLSYKEYFEYIPDSVLDIVVPITIQTLVKSGLPSEAIKRISKNGVSIEMDGNTAMIVGSIMSELFIQKRFTEEEILQIEKIINRTRNALVNSSDLEFEWNNEIRTRFVENLTQTGRIIQKHPSILSEMEDVAKKYSRSIEKVRTKLKKPPKINE